MCLEIIILHLKIKLTLSNIISEINAEEKLKNYFPIRTIIINKN